jgi:hypothetical protein
MRSSFFSDFDFDFLNAKLRSKKLRFDIGTSISAPVSRCWFSQLHDLFVVGVEPNPACLDEENLWNGKTWSIQGVFNDHPQSDNYYHIVGACDNVRELKISKFHLLRGNVGCSSLLLPKIHSIPGCEYDREIEVETFSLEMFLENVDYTHIEMIKVDAQGKDLDIIKSLGSHIQRVQYIDMEDDSRYQYENASSREEMIEFMRTQNFSLYHVLSGNLRFSNNLMLDQTFSNFTGDL